MTDVQVEIVVEMAYVVRLTPRDRMVAGTLRKSCRLAVPCFSGRDKSVGRDRCRCADGVVAHWYTAPAAMPIGPSLSARQGRLYLGNSGCS